MAINWGLRPYTNTSAVEALSLQPSFPTTMNENNPPGSYVHNEHSTQELMLARIFLRPASSDEGLRKEKQFIDDQLVPKSAFRSYSFSTIP